MKNLFVFLILNVSMLMLRAQEHKPQLLMEPSRWEFERFQLPPVFAPAITYKGAEELRFAPGMFNKDSESYFTYVFVVQLDNVPSISQADIHEYLLNYYRGLCRATARDRKLVIDTTQISVVIERQSNRPVNKNIYNASASIFGVFADGAPVKLNMEVQVLVDAQRKRTYLFILASPREKNDAIWETLFGTREKFTVPG